MNCAEDQQSGIVPASVAPSGVAFPYTIAGELCATPEELQDGTTIQLLIHGATYNHTYWDFGTIDGVQYSYARHLATAGIPTFAIDELGAGQSTRPPSGDVTSEVTAYVAHQVLQGLRDGSITGTRFGKVIEVGHSAGSLTSLEEAITYQDVDGLIITGLTHHFTAAGTTDLTDDMHSANADAKFAGVTSITGDGGYLTTLPGTRGGFFYNGADADPNVVAADDNQTPFVSESFGSETGKDTFSTGQFDGFAVINSSETQAIEVPVLLILGGKDDLFCGPDAQGANSDCSSGAAIVRQEAPFYSAQARLGACAVPNAGHDIALHLNAALEEVEAAAWSYHWIGQRGQLGPGALPGDCG